MADDDDTRVLSETSEALPHSAADASAFSQPSDQPDVPTPAPTMTEHPESRAALIERAKLFLVSPQILHEDLAAKRRFLVEKGLSDDEIGGLLQELVSNCVIAGHTLLNRFFSQ